MLALGESIIKEEVLFNEKAGISRHENDLPKFLRTEELHSGLVFEIDLKELENIFQ